MVWKLRPDKTLEPVRIRTGITDHTVTEVAQILKGQLNEGDELVTGGVAASSGATRAPGLGGGARPRERWLRQRHRLSFQPLASLATDD